MKLQDNPRSCILGANEVKLIFSNFVILKQISETFLRDLGVALYQNGGFSDTSTIGQVFLNLVSSCSVFSPPPLSLFSLSLSISFFSPSLSLSHSTSYHFCYCR